jgi:hypothetical protein
MELISKPRYCAYSLKGVSLADLVEELPGSNAERWEHFNDHLVAAHISNCISHKDNNKKLPIGQFYLSWTSLSDIVGRNKGDHSYTKYFEVLKRLGIAYPLQEGKKGYMSGEVCKKYSFTKKQLDLGFNHVQLLSPRVIKRQLKQIEKEAAIESENYADVHFELAKMVANWLFQTTLKQSPISISNVNPNSVKKKPLATCKKHTD